MTMLQCTVARIIDKMRAGNRRLVMRELTDRNATVCRLLASKVSRHVEWRDNFGHRYHIFVL